MGLFSFLKEKIVGKSTKQKDKYVAGLDKSRRNFSSKLKSLAFLGTFSTKYACVLSFA